MLFNFIFSFFPIFLEFEDSYRGERQVGHSLLIMVGIQEQAV